MLKLIVFALALTTVAAAQTFNPPQLTFSGPIATSVTQCVVPPAHSASICPVESPIGTISYFFWNGSSWVSFGVATPVAAVLSVNGKKPDAAGDVSFTITPVPSTTLVVPAFTPSLQ